MQSMGFGESRGNGYSFVSSVSMFVLVNGTPAGFFQTSRGLRQGDASFPASFYYSNGGAQSIDSGSHARSFFCKALRWEGQMVWG